MAWVEQFCKLVGPLFKHAALRLISKSLGSNSFVLKLWRLFVLEGGVAEPKQIHQKKLAAVLHKIYSKSHVSTGFFSVQAIKKFEYPVTNYYPYSYSYSA